MELPIGRAKHITFYPFERQLKPGEVQLVQAAIASIKPLRAACRVDNGVNPGLYIDDEILSGPQRRVQIDGLVRALRISTLANNKRSIAS